MSGFFLTEDLVVLDRNEERGAKNKRRDSVKDGFTTHLPCSGSASHGDFK